MPPDSLRAISSFAAFSPLPTYFLFTFLLVEVDTIFFGLSFDKYLSNTKYLALPISTISQPLSVFPITLTFAAYGRATAFSASIEMINFSLRPC